MGIIYEKTKTCFTVPVLVLLQSFFRAHMASLHWLDYGIHGLFKRCVNPLVLVPLRLTWLVRRMNDLH